MLANVAQTVVTGVLNRLFGQQGAAPQSSASSTASQPTSPTRNTSNLPEASTEAPRPEGPPEWYRNFFAPSPDPPRPGGTSPTPEERQASSVVESVADAMAEPPVDTTAVQADASQQPETNELPRRTSTPSLAEGAGRDRRRPFPGAQDLRRTPSSTLRTPARTPPTSGSRPSTPGTYLYNPGEVGTRPSPLFARPFFQLPGQSPPSGSSQPTASIPLPGVDSPPPVASSASGAPAQVPGQYPSASDSVTSARAASVPERTPIQDPSARAPSAPAFEVPDMSEVPGVPPTPTFSWSNAEANGGAVWGDEEPRGGASPPPQLEQAAQAEQAEWGKQRPEDDPPEPLAEELLEYRRRQAERERRARADETQ